MRSTEKLYAEIVKRLEERGSYKIPIADWSDTLANILKWRLLNPDALRIKHDAKEGCITLSLDDAETIAVAKAHVQTIVRALEDEGLYIISQSEVVENLAQIKWGLGTPDLLTMQSISETEIQLSYPKNGIDSTEWAYHERGFWRKFLPIAVFGLLYFIICYILGSGHGRLVSICFLLGIPIVLGALVTYSYQYENPTPYYSKDIHKTLWIFMGLCFVASIFILKEGSICIILASPFLVVGVYLGSAIMGGLCRLFWKPQKIVYSLAVIPLLLLLVPEQPSDYFGNTHQSVVINATPKQIWQQINQAQDIQPREVKNAWIYKIGVPYPVSGMTKQTDEGLIRYSIWQKGIHFEELIDHWQPNQFVSWRYRFQPDSIPKDALDDHVTIGGKYFDLLDTSYRLTPMNNQQTRLDINVNYRVSTDMNFYAGFVADTLIGDFSTVILALYKTRSESMHSTIVSTLANSP